MKQIEKRDEVAFLVRSFYAKIRKDELLGPIFNSTIKDWEEHLELLTDFWETQLFYKKKYLGNPLEKHVEVDKAHGGVINELHFGTWLNLWYETLDEHFEGEVANMAKNRARSMGTFIHLKIFEARG